MTNPHPLLTYDPAGAGLTDADRAALAGPLQAARDEVLKHDLDDYHSGSIPEKKKPLDAGFIEMPERLLADYRSDPAGSELGRILQSADRLAAAVDRVVVLGIGGSYMGARAVMEACCHPYFNELSRAERGGRPRMYFEGNNVDNDASQGLLDLLGRGTTAAGVDRRWAIVVISKSGGTMETAVALRQFLAALMQSLGDDVAALAELVVPITGNTGKLADLADAIGCTDRYLVPDGVGGRFSVLSPVGLLPAALLLGDGVVQLLEGAAAMNAHFRDAPPGSNAVLDYVGVCHHLETSKGIDLRVLSAWAKSLEAVGLWYDQLLAESLGKDGRGATPLTVVNTRDLHSRAQQHQEGAADKVFTNLIVDRWTRKPLPVGHSDWNQDELNEIAERTLPEIMTAAIDGTNTAYRTDNRPTADIRLPRLDAATLGQLLQMLMLATVVEGRLIDINPYGQPGVEQYKKHMRKNLGLE